MKRNKAIYIKITIAILALILAVAIIWQLAPLMINLSTQEGQLEFREKIENMGIAGGFMLFGLDIIQVILMVLPAEPLEILAGMCYGPLGGLIFIIASSLISTIIIYLLIGKLGKKFLKSFMSQKRLEKIEKSELMTNTTKIEIALLILFLIPGTSKDLLVYIGSLLPIKPVPFILIATFARFPSVLSSTIIGERLLYGDLGNSAGVYVGTFIITLIGIVVAIKVGGKETKELIKMIK